MRVCVWCVTLCVVATWWLVCAGEREQAHLRRAHDPWLAHAARAYLDAGYCDGAGADRSSAVRWWVRWTRRRGMSVVQMVEPSASSAALRAVEDTLILFAVWLVEARGVAAATARAYVSTVRAWHGRRFGEMMPGFQAVRLRAVLKGMRVVRPSGPRKPRQGVSTQVLATGMGVAFGDDADGRSAVAALSLAFCGLLRVSEYASHSARRQYNRAELPVVGDVTFSSDGEGEFAVVMVRPRKKGVKSRGKSAAVIVRDGSLLQPVAALKAMIRGRNAASTEPLFLWQGRPLTIRTVTRLVRMVAMAAGVDPRPLSSHSLRIGGATAALAAGVPPAAIRVMGRWDSDIYEIYCRRSRQVAMRLGAVIASTPFDEVEGAFQDEELMW